VNISTPNYPQARFSHKIVRYLAYLLPYVGFPNVDYFACDNAP